MNSYFLNRYTQALGAILGIFACIYAYLNGWMYVYGNINKNFDALGFGGVISSYFLLPLCLIMLILSIINSHISDKQILNIPIDELNKNICIISTIIGILGAKAYFLIPSAFTLFSIYKEWFKREEKTKNKTNENEFKNTKEHSFLDEEFLNSPLESLNNAAFLNQQEEIALEKEMKTLETKKIMALELLSKKSDIQFITDITGLTLKEIQELKKQA